MSSKPLISIVIIFLNAERFMREAVESVFAQTYHNWELLLVDDGSTDGSTAIAQHYVDRDAQRVRYLTHPGRANCGMSVSRNVGIRNAKGQYVALLDADDVWLPHKLEQQVAILNSHPQATMVYGPTQWWYSWTRQPEDIPRDFVNELGVPPNTLINPPTLLTLFLRNEGISPCTCSMLVRREVLELTGGFEEGFRGLYEDQAFCAKLCLDSIVFASAECWYRYRQHPDSACAVAQKTGQHRQARLIFLNWLAAYLAARQVKHAEVWRALEDELWRLRHPISYRLKERTRGLLRVMNASAKSIVTTVSGG
jgi:glycosyltransferase involved in cell wall biosynthesis